MKKIAAIAVITILISGCGTGNGGVFRERIVPDIERVFSADNEVFLAYGEAISAAEALAENYSTESINDFVSAAEKSDALARESMSVKSGLGTEEHAAMERLNIPGADYDYLFEQQPLSMESMASWTYIAKWASGNSDTETLTHLIALQKHRLEAEKVYLLYGAMDLVADTDAENAEYFRETLYNYEHVIPEDCEWLKNHDDINRVFNEKYDTLEEQINGEQIYLNKLTNELRQAQGSVG